jgi:uncharacterized protein YdaT
MPWTKSYYPDSLKDLPVSVRDEAIEIANRLLEEKKEEDDLVTAVNKVRNWDTKEDKRAKKYKWSKRIREKDRLYFID